jgi:hypothetical protein
LLAVQTVQREPGTSSFDVRLVSECVDDVSGADIEDVGQALYASISMIKFDVLFSEQAL